MFLERLALEESLRGDRMTSEAPVYRQLRPYRRTPEWRVRIISRLGKWMVAKGNSLQRGYRHEVACAKRHIPRQMEQAT